MKKFLLILAILTVVCVKGLAQNNEQIFSITIDSIKNDPATNPKVLLCYTTIKNLSKETIEFRESSMFRKHRKERMWNLNIKKDGHILCTWIDKHDVLILLGNFTIKKNNSIAYPIVIILDEVVVDSGGGVGSYSIQIEVSNVKTKKVKKQTVQSNILEFQIETPIGQYSKD